MSQSFISSALILWLVLFAGSLHAQKDNWVLAKSGEGIEVFTQDREGGKIKEFKSVMTVNCTVQALERELDNTTNYPVWQENCDGAVVLQKTSDKIQIERYFTDSPWPIADRDIVMQLVKERQANGSLTYTRKSVPDAHPPVGDFMRIREAAGMWLIEPIDAQSTRITYRFYADPGGSLPAWLVNSFIVTGPYNTFVNLKKRVEAKKG
jgi:hypothetical protein